MNIPLLLNHDHQKIIGAIRSDGGRLQVEFLPEVRVTRDQFFAIFGNAGARVLEHEMHGEETIIRKAEILEFSLSDRSPEIQPSKPWPRT